MILFELTFMRIMQCLVRVLLWPMEISCAVAICFKGPTVPVVGSPFVVDHAVSLWTLWPPYFPCLCICTVLYWFFYPPKLVLLKVLSLVSTAFTFLWTLELMSQYFDCNLYNTGFLVLVIFRLPVTVVFLNVHTGGWRDGSVVGRACCSFRGPELNSRQPCLPTPNHL